jgi:hypothetical protein
MFTIWRQAGAWLSTAGVGVGGLLGAVPWPVAALLLVLVVTYLGLDRALRHRENMAAIAKTADGAPLESAAPVVTALRAPPLPARQVMGGFRPRPRSRARVRQRGQR